MYQNYLLKLFLMLISYFSPISTLIHVVLLFVTIDILTGSYASYINKEAIVSHRLRKTIEKFVFYSLSIIVSFIFQKEIVSWINLTQLVAGFVASIEILSIYENIRKITGIDIANQVKKYLKESINKFKN